MGRYLSSIEADAELSAAWQNFSQVCAEQAAALDLSPGDLAAIADAADGFREDLAGWEAAKAAAQSALTRKNSRREASRELLARYARAFRANEAVSDALLTRLRLAPHRTPGTRSEPGAPTDLVAWSDGDGNVSLKWNRAGNRKGTIFIIQLKDAPEGAWQILDTTAATRYRTQRAPGRYAAFRVIAKRRGLASAPCTPAVLWPAGVGVELQVAA